MDLTIVNNSKREMIAWRGISLNKNLANAVLIRRFKTLASNRNERGVGFGASLKVKQS